MWHRDNAGHKNSGTALKRSRVFYLSGTGVKKCQRAFPKA